MINFIRNRKSLQAFDRWSSFILPILFFDDGGTMFTGSRLKSSVQINFRHSQKRFSQVGND